MEENVEIFESTGNIERIENGDEFIGLKCGVNV